MRQHSLLVWGFEKVGSFINLRITRQQRNKECCLITERSKKGIWSFEKVSRHAACVQSIEAGFVKTFFTENQTCFVKPYI